MKIRYYGHVGQPTGYGRAGEHLCLALIRAGADLEIRPLLPRDGAPGQLSTPELLPLAHRTRGDIGLSAADVAIVHTQPGDCRVVLNALSDGPIASRYVAYTTWEGIRAPPSVRAALRGFDQIWAPSHAAALAFATQTDEDGELIPVAVIPHAYDPAAAVRRSPLTDHSYSFAWWGAWNNRKNPIGLLRAYAHAFTNKDVGVNLHLHSADLTREVLMLAMGSTGIEPDAFPSITFSSGRRPLSDLVGATDCFATAARGEAWNLPAFEAAFLGDAHVIAPAGQGSDDYLTHTGACLYGAMASPAWRDVRFADGGGVCSTGAWGLDSKSLWWEPDLRQLATYMRAAFTNRVRGIRASYDPVAHYGYDAVGRLMMTTLAEIMEMR